MCYCLLQFYLNSYYHIKQRLSWCHNLKSKPDSWLCVILKYAAAVGYLINFTDLCYNIKIFKSFHIFWCLLGQLYVNSLRKWIFYFLYYSHSSSVSNNTTNNCQIIVSLLITSVEQLCEGRLFEEKRPYVTFSVLRSS